MRGTSLAVAKQNAKLGTSFATSLLPRFVRYKRYSMNGNNGNHFGGKTLVIAIVVAAIWVTSIQFLVDTDTQVIKTISVPAW